MNEGRNISDQIINEPNMVDSMMKIIISSKGNCCNTQQVVSIIPIWNKWNFNKCEKERKKIGREREREREKRGGEGRCNEK